MQYVHVDPSLLQICAKTQPPATPASHIIVMYMAETNLSLKFYIYIIYLK